MNILALDVSSTNIGWCIEANGALTSGTVKLVGPIERRLCLAETAINHLVQRFQPEAAAIEAPAYGSKSLVVQQRTAGVVLLVLARWKLLTAEIAPTSAKKALTGSGRADKAAMITAAQNHLSGKFDEHAADALAVRLAAQNVFVVGAI